MMEAHLQWMSEGRWLVSLSEGKNVVGNGPVGFIVPGLDPVFWSTEPLTAEGMAAVQEKLQEISRKDRGWA